MKPHRKHIPKICKYCTNQSYMTPKKENFDKTKKSVKVNKKITNLERIITNIKAYNKLRALTKTVT